MLRGIFRTKSLDDILEVAGGPQFSLRRSLGAFNVTLIGIGAIIGAIVGGKKGAGIGALGGAGGSALYSYKIKPKQRRY